MLLRILASGVLAFFLVYVMVPYLRRLANHLNWLDVANVQRKVHADSIPLVGGAAMALAILACVALNAGEIGLLSGLTATLLTGATILLVTGLIDDKLDLSPLIKLFAQAACAYFIVFRGLHFDAVFRLVQMDGLPDLVRQAISALFVVGLVNAYNLIDGIDGLAGSLFAVAFAWIGAAAFYLGAYDIALLSALVLGASVAFLRFNTSRTKKIFMGDGGSLFLGYLLAGCTIGLLERGAVEPAASLWLVGTCAVLALPVLDELRVFAERMASGKSPLYADRTHVHHILLQIDPAHRSVRNWILRIVLLTFLMAVSASVLAGVWGGVTVILVCVAALFVVLQAQRSMQQHREELRTLELRGSDRTAPKSTA